MVSHPTGAGLVVVHGRVVRAYERTFVYDSDTNTKKRTSQAGLALYLGRVGSTIPHSHD